MPTNTCKFLTDVVFDRQKTMDFKTYFLLLLRHLAIDRANNRSFPISSRLNRSPHILPESRAFKNLSPHISPTTRAEICCKVPIKSPYSPTSTRGPHLGEADDKCINGINTVYLQRLSHNIRSLQINKTNTF